MIFAPTFFKTSHLVSHKNKTLRDTNDLINYLVFTDFDHCNLNNLSGE